VDRKALPDPVTSRPELETAFVGPRNSTEEKLAKIWTEVLGLDQVGIHDNFFDLGGHSLLAAKLFTRLDEEFGRVLSLSVLFAAPTVCLLAEHYLASMAPKKFSALVPLKTEGSLPPVFAVPGVFGNVVGLADLCRGLGAEQPFYGLQSIGLDGKEAPFDSIEEVASLYVSEIRRVQSYGPYALIGACFGARVACEMAYQLLKASEEIAFLGLLDPIGLIRDEAIETPASSFRTINRTQVLGRFVTDRLGLYFEELRGEIYQLEVFKANRLAGRRYHRKSLNGDLRSLEIFMLSHPRNTRMETFNWKTLWGGETVRHHVPGKDSGDMLSGENAQVLAELLRERLRAAFEGTVAGAKSAQSADQTQNGPTAAPLAQMLQQKHAERIQAPSRVTQVSESLSEEEAHCLLDEERGKVSQGERHD
jgi:acyl carrier protein